MKWMESARLKRNRSVGALSYGWLSPGSPDPAGRRLDVVRQALTAHPRIEAFFWSVAPASNSHFPLSTELG